MYLLTGDWHLDDNPANEYRWGVFKRLRDVFKKYTVAQLFILGDLCHKKDRHSAFLVNRLTQELISLAAEVDIIIIMGNHDKPIRGIPYWYILNSMGGGNGRIFFYDEPLIAKHYLLLPYSSNPGIEWQELLAAIRTEHKAIFMHQTVSGARGDNGHLLAAPNMPELPTGIQIYSGDLHTPQTVRRNIHYIGAPHPVNYGDHYLCRFVMLDDKFKVKEEIKLSPPRKLVIEISSFDDLVKQTHEAGQLFPGDMARIRFKMPATKAASWPAEEATVREWAEEQGIKLASVEAVLEMGEASQTVDSNLTTPEEILRSFADAEGIDDGLLDIGLSLLNEGDT